MAIGGPKRDDRQQHQEREQRIGVGVSSGMVVEKAERRGEHEAGEQRHHRPDRSTNPQLKHQHGEPCRDDGREPQRQQIGAEGSKREGNQPDVERGFRVVVVERFAKRGANPLAVLKHLPGAHAVERFIPFDDNLTPKAKRQVECGKKQDGAGEQPIAPRQHGARPSRNVRSTDNRGRCKRPWICRRRSLHLHGISIVGRPKAITCDGPPRGVRGIYLGEAEDDAVANAGATVSFTVGGGQSTSVPLRGIFKVRSFEPGGNGTGFRGFA